MPEPAPVEWSSTRVAEFLDTYRSTVLDIPRERLPYREVGRRRMRRYRPADVRAYAAGQEPQPPEPGTIADHEARLQRIERVLGLGDQP